MVNVQKSFGEEGAKLYVVPTPIGNLEDLTFRALKVLENSDLIACEDTRQTQKLLNFFDLNNSLISFHEHSHDKRTEDILQRIHNGESIALVSDAGMPLISDPGYTLVSRAREEGIDVVVLPGANAALCALVGSGLPTNSFTFAGFLPKKKKEIVNILESLDQQQHTLIFYESPYRVTKTLEVMKEVYSSDRKVTLARELTKKFEEYISGSINDVYEWSISDDSTIRGEFCIIVEPIDEKDMESDIWWDDLSLVEHVEYYMENEQLKTKAAVKRVAQDRGLSSRDVYNEFHQ
ncbi:16S rRNA (cytidine(1402)-2'-O)-methyltransferase [Alkalibacillus haloalkaliphilus]|nr:16S rRNA (cytidine(1402)-2'-O)-methyltransferase [Alkalibacillus haloalkaliphilus]MDV2583265.1 16S rRNA (cytidine(1402)-2'-O)-methyltransferase [Alkalibacillus haloalkaliphilus]